MKKSLGAACAGALLMACSGMQPLTPVPPPQRAAQAVALLEQACLDDPADPARWAQLAAALAAGGERDRAATMYQQAAALRDHDIRRDYALLGGAGQEGAAEDMPRTEVRQIGAAMVQVLRIPAGAKTPERAPQAAGPATPVVRMEISNGNGVTGAAARLAHALDTDGVRTVRLTNVRPFVVPLSRIEYQRDQQQLARMLSQRYGLRLQPQRVVAPYAEMRIVLGRDAAQAGYLK